ncbi:MAG: hypothetical protein WBP45_07430 [Daejeonella sp.]
MNQIYKSIVLFLFISTSVYVNAQDLAYKIPQDALAVASVKGNNLLQLLSVQEFNNSFLGKKILAEASKKANANYQEIEDLGFDLGSSFYYYNRSTDSVSYNCFLIPIKDVKKLDKLLNSRKFTREGNVRTYYNQYDSTEVTIWDNHMLLLTKAEKKYSYFDREDVSKRLGWWKEKEDYNYENIATAEVMIEEPPITDYNVADQEDSKPVKPKVVKKSKSAKVKSNKSKTVKKGKAVKKPAKTVKKEKVFKEEEVETIEVYADTTITDSASYDNTYSNDYYYLKEAKQKKVLIAWTKQMARDMFFKQNSGSIMTNASYLKSLDSEAEATLWIGNAEELFYSYLNFPYYPTSLFKKATTLNGSGNINAKLFMEKDAIRISTEMELTDEQVAINKKLTSRKLNKKFIKYLNEDRMIGYMGYAVDSKAYLEAYPKLVSGIYSSIYEDEAALASDFISLLLDEEAISKVLKGDGLFILTGVTQKEVTYKTYDYDEEYKATEVEKVKKETTPEFLFMTTTEDTRFLEKLIKYGIKKQVVSANVGFYKITLPKNTMNLYVMIKDGIIFLGTNITDMEKIAANRFDAKISKEHKNMLLQNNFSLFSSQKNMGEMISLMKNTSDTREWDRAHTIFNSMGNVYMKSNKLKGNIASGEVLIQAQGNYSNSLQYLFSIIEKGLN